MDTLVEKENPGAEGIPSETAERRPDAKSAFGSLHEKAAQRLWELKEKRGGTGICALAFSTNVTTAFAQEGRV